MNDILETFKSMMGDARQAAEDAVELAYDRGREAERAKIVAWLRSDEEGEWVVADAIERGDYRNG